MAPHHDCSRQKALGKLRIGLFYPTHLPLSLANYADNVTHVLAKQGVHFTLFGKNKALPENVDLYWDPRGGRGAPTPLLRKTKKPVVATFHGAAHIALPLWECFDLKPGVLWAGHRDRKQTIAGWQMLRNNISAIIAVSKYAKKEVEDFFGFPSSKIYSIYHGVNHNVFQPSKEPQHNTPYILHISSYQPKKNINRIVKAYNRLSVPDKPRLVMLIPQYPKRPTPRSKVEVITREKDHSQIKLLYQNAICFLFPSLHETFGMPILEAMASGCPTITSNLTACPEAAGDAAILVNPRSTKEISEALEKVIQNNYLRDAMRRHGLQRAKLFSWHQTAQQHLDLFQSLLSNH